MTSKIHNLSISDEGKTVTVNGWVEKIRDHGGVIFIDLRNDLEILQVVIEPEERKIFETKRIKLDVLKSEKIIGLN